MGYFLLRESMFDSIICARDRWLKPDGVMYPSHARMWVAPIRSGLVDQKMNDFECAMNDWHNFVAETEANYGVNMNVLTKPYTEENQKYYLKTSFWSNLHPNQIVGTPAIIKEIDCLTATIDEIRDVTANFSLGLNVDRTMLSGVAGWFDVHFRGSMQNPAIHEIELNTAPSSEDSTHWGQQVFLLHPSPRVNSGDAIIASFSMSRNRENHRLMDVEFTYELQQSTGKRLPPVTSRFYIE
ncbi:protein arginine N-methyltransferase PRMT10 [Iris pallida]|uniref:Protein arginine N-methyltransferase PRMT10 n=1 Tax=Iris pallida TaxID=29817 RepID=A0AAX6IHP6_IRIPA|nr:protein arginine N-methyltransferase PRMT10 [Iris pallida]